MNFITELQGLTYVEKLNELGLQTLQARRERLDMIQIFKIMKGFASLQVHLVYSNWSRGNQTDKAHSLP